MGPLVVSIIAFNEEHHIAAAIGSAHSVTEEIVVLDSYSTDSTARIARDEGAVVLQREFDDFSSQRNWVLDQIQERYGADAWILTIDADERIDNGLARAIRAELEQPKCDGYLIKFLIHFDGRPLRFGGLGRKYFMRFFRVDSGRYSLGVHEQLIPRKKFVVGKLAGALVHVDVASWDRYIEKHNQYSTLEARALVENSSRIISISIWDAIRNPVLRRRWLRDSIWRRLPAKPLLRFVHIYVLMGGFLDGRPGFRRALFAAWQNMCIIAKHEELKRGTTEPFPTGLKFAPARNPSTRDLVVCILTHNEEPHIAEAIRSGKQLTDHVVVVDSFSTDNTRQVATKEGARVWQHPFTSHTDQRNWGIDQIQKEFGDVWIFDLDADERISQELAAEVSSLGLNRLSPYAAYTVKRQLYFDRTQLRFGGFAKTKIARLYKTSAGRYEHRPINEHLALKASLEVGTLKNWLIHTDIRSWEHHISKHNKIATLEAQARATAIDSRKGVVSARQAIRQPFLRRRWLRERIWNRLPARPFLRFVQSAIIGGGFLDGRAGLRIALFNAWTEMCIDLKYEEMTHDSGERELTDESREVTPAHVRR